MIRGQMIEFLGVGLPREGGRWWLHRVCARLGGTGTTAVLSRDRGERVALLDTVTARRIPVEGRVWVGGIPVMRETAARVRLEVGDVDFDTALAAHRSLLWNTLARGSPGLAALQGALRMPRPAQRAEALDILARLGISGAGTRRGADLLPEERARILVARELMKRPRYVVLREVDEALGPAAAEILVRLVPAVAASPVAVLASFRSIGLARALAGRVLGLADGALVVDAQPPNLDEDEIAWRLGLDGHEPRRGARARS